MSDYVNLRWSVAHDFCRPSHRNPTGAVPVGTPVDILLWVERGEQHRVSKVTLLVGEPEQAGDRLFWHEVPLYSTERGFAGTITGATRPEAMFYLFLLDFSDGGMAYYVPRGDARSTAGRLVEPHFDGYFTDAGWVPAARNDRPSTAEDYAPLQPQPGFQITFYDPSFTTPDWLEGSVMYQIFPERFARGKNGVRTDGLEYHRSMGRPVNLHEDWNEPAEWEGGKEYDPVDFFGGTIDGIREKLPYIASLGVEVLYLNPVFEARSNHRYDTADYDAVDPLLGSNDDLKRLISEADTWGIRIVLDAVLSHTGADSKYFNALETYDEPGAVQGWHSPYRPWYDFEHPNGPTALYRCWWGDPTLPEVDERNPVWQRYILGDIPSYPGSEIGVLGRWMNAGVSGYRLDVADEIPDDVLERIRRSVKGHDPQAAIIGEVWEDATNKASYGSWRTYALGQALDTVMNYPLRAALLGFASGIVDARQLVTFLKTQKSNYPEPMYRCLMNLMSSHDVERQRSYLSLGGPLKQLPRERQQRAVAGITAEQDRHGADLQRMLAGILYALPGMPCLYYGDERGLQGGGDPFCRETFPWDDNAQRSDRGYDLMGFYQRLGQLRRRSVALRQGDMACCALDTDSICIVRTIAKNRGAELILANRSDTPKDVGFDLCELVGKYASYWHFRPLWSSSWVQGATTWHQVKNEGGVVCTTIPPLSTVYFQTES